MLCADLALKKSGQQAKKFVVFFSVQTRGRGPPSQLDDETFIYILPSQHFSRLMTASVVGARSGNFAHIHLYTRFGDESDHLPAASVAERKKALVSPVEFCLLNWVFGLFVTSHNGHGHFTAQSLLQVSILIFGNPTSISNLQYRRGS